jgi:hypothetical protein
VRKFACFRLGKAPVQNVVGVSEIFKPVFFILPHTLVNIVLFVSQECTNRSS